MQGLGKQKVGYFRKISQMASKFGFFCVFHGFVVGGGGALNAAELNQFM
jgi:hypothetical protein